LDWCGNLSSVEFVNELPRGQVVHKGVRDKDVAGNTGTTKTDYPSERSKIYVVEEIVRGIEKQSDSKLSHIGDIIKEAEKQSMRKH